MSIESVNSPEESLWRAVILRYSNDIFRLKVDMDQSHIKMIVASGEKDDNDNKKMKWQRYRKTFEHSSFKMQQFRNELEASVVDGKEILHMREVCENANVSFDVFRSRILDIMDGLIDVPDQGKKYIFEN